MSDDRREIALQVLRAAGHDQAAELVEAIIPGAAPVAAAAAPAAPAELTQQQQANELAGTPPAGEFTLADYDRMPRNEQKAFALTDEGDAAITAALRRE